MIVNPHVDGLHQSLLVTMLLLLFAGVYLGCCLMPLNRDSASSRHQAIEAFNVLS